MKQNGMVNRIKFVLSLIGKPVYWLLLSPVLLFFFAKHTSEYILHQTGIFLFSFLHARVQKKAKKNKRTKKTVIVFERQKKSISTLYLLKTKIEALFARAKTTQITKKKVAKKKKSTPLAPRSQNLFVRHARFFILVIFILSLSSVGAYAFYETILKDLPTPNDLINHKPIVTTKIYDRNHILLYKIYKDENRSVVSLDRVSPYVKEATIAIEDKDFYTHKGVSLRGILRVAKLAFTQGKIQGGSTITQQLVKNTLLSRERTLVRKIKEIILAMQVETSLSKDQILEMYLNNVSYGGSVYGIEEASQHYFHKSASDLDLAEASFLAGLPAAPSIYSPSGPTSDLAFGRQHEVLGRLVNDGKISSLESETARNEPLVFQPETTDIKAPHFVMYIRDLLAREYGDELVTQGGLEVVTTLDYTLQQQVEKIVATEVKQLAPLRVSNGAALVTNPKTGEILAMVGSHDYFDVKHDGQVNVTLRPRQPGSSIKPLMYSAALERGFTPATIIDDSPIVYQNPGSPPYAPKNYDGAFHGKETLRYALASSHNVPAVKTEASIGLSAFIDNARQLGISTWNDTSRFGLSLTLGSGEILMTDLATAYGVFANGGVRMDLNPLLSVKKYTGEDMYENTCALGSSACEGTAVMDPRIAFQITSMLSDNKARSRAFGMNSVLNIPGQQVAVKTGTTNNLRDNWTFGYTANRLVATWVGNNDNRPMSNVTSGITGASPIWNKIMHTQLSEEHPSVFSVPSNLEAASICASTGRPPCDGSCQPSYTEYFLPGTRPTPQCVSAATAAAPTPVIESKNNTRQAAARDRILNGATSESWDSYINQ